MKARSIRVPDDIDKAIAYVSRVERIEKTQSLRKLAKLGFDFYVATNYQAGKLSLREASELLELYLFRGYKIFLSGTHYFRDIPDLFGYGRLKD